MCVCNVFLSYWDRFRHVFFVEQSVIDAQNDPVKQGAVQRFGHGVSGCDSLMSEGEGCVYCDFIELNFKGVLYSVFSNYNLM